MSSYSIIDWNVCFTFYLLSIKRINLNYEEVYEKEYYKFVQYEYLYFLHVLRTALFSYDAAGGNANLVNW